MLDSSNVLITEAFVCGWKDSVLYVDGIELEVNEALIDKVSNTLIEGTKFYRDKKCETKVMETFFLPKEREKVRKNTYGGWERTFLSKPWWDVSEVIMHYLTLNSKFWNLFSYHFVILNHFQHS